MNNTSMNPCFGCGKPLHISAPSCPHCGAVQNLPNQLGPNAAMRSVNGVELQSKVTAGVLALLLGGIGIHKFYTGAWGWGIVYIVLCWTYIPALVALVEGIRYLTLKQPEFAQKAARMDGPFSFLW